MRATCYRFGEFLFHYPLKLLSYVILWPLKLPQTLFPSILKSSKEKMGQEKWKERGVGEKAESKTRKNESKFAVSAHGPNFGRLKFCMFNRSPRSVRTIDGVSTSLVSLYSQSMTKKWLDNKLQKVFCSKIPRNEWVNIPLMRRRPWRLSFEWERKKEAWRVLVVENK